MQRLVPFNANKGEMMLRGKHVLWLALLAFAVPGQAAETRREEIGDWGFVCTAAGDAQAKESCNLFQTALLNVQQEDDKEASAQRVLLTQVRYVEGNDKPVLLVTAPLGILLPMGITVEVEGHETIRIPVQRCDAGGCLAYVAMEEPFVDAFRKAVEARVTFHDAQRRGIGIPLSLKGFTKGLEALAEAR